MLVIPEPGQLKPVAQLLLALADHPNQVAMVSSPQQGFAVPKELFDKFEAAYHKSEDDGKKVHLAAEMPVKEPNVAAPVVTARPRPDVSPQPEQPKRRTGRPRKSQGKE